MSRRSFPLTAVEAFIVTARHLNLTHAAKELCLTQGAVSRKIAALESWFGFPLFERHARGLHLTHQGCALLPELQSAYENLLDVTDRACRKASVIRLKAPTCAMRWLVPKIVELEHSAPDIQIVLTTTIEHGINFKNEPYDAAIVFGPHAKSGTLLFEETLTPVISESLLHKEESAEDALQRLTFLHPTRDRTDWSLWLAGDPALRPAMSKNQHFDTMDLAISAAIQGFGIAIADETLVAEDLRMGRLVRPFSHSVKTGASYRLCVRQGSENTAGLAAFCTSLLNIS